MWDTTVVSSALCAGLYLLSGACCQVFSVARTQVRDLRPNPAKTLPCTSGLVHLG